MSEETQIVNKTGQKKYKMTVKFFHFIWSF